MPGVSASSLWGYQLTVLFTYKAESEVYFLKTSQPACVSVCVLATVALMFKIICMVLCLDQIKDGLTDTQFSDCSSCSAKSCWGHIIHTEMMTSFFDSFYLSPSCGSLSFHVTPSPNLLHTAITMVTAWKSGVCGSKVCMCVCVMG